MAEVMDNAAVEAPVETAEVDASLPEEVEGVASDETDASLEQAEPEVEQEADVKVDNRKMPVALKNHLNELAQSNPQLAKELRGIFFANQQFTREFPGGIQEVQRLKQIFTQAGGEQGIQALHSDMQFYNDLDQKWINADPSLVSGLAQFNPQSFSKLMPHMLSKYAETDGESYARTMAGVILSTFQNSGVTNTLYLAKQMLASGNVAEATNLLNGLDKWIADMDSVAKTQPKARQQDPLAAERQRLAQQSSAYYEKSVGQAVSSHRFNLVKQELGNYLKGKPLDGERERVFMEQVERQIVSTLNQDQQFMQNILRFKQAQDHDGAVRLMTSRQAEVIPDAVKKVYKILGFGTPVAGNKPALKAGEKPVANGKPAVPAPKGWVKVNKQPSPQDIDRSSGKTTFEMIYNNQAILKDGRRVTWDTKK